MFSLASTETQSSIESSVCVGHGQFERGPLLVAGREPPGRRHNTDTAQLLRLTGFKEEEVEMMKTLFDFYDGDRDGKLSIDQACTLGITLGYHPVEQSSIRSGDDGRVTFRQFVQSAGYMMAKHTSSAHRGGPTKHFFRMASRNSTEPMTSTQVYRFFQGIGVDLPLSAVERMTMVMSRFAEPRLREDDLVQYVEYTRRKAESIAALSKKKSGRALARMGS